MNYLIVIPALDPKSDLIEYVDTLINYGCSRILVVDDGSGAECRPVFDEIETREECSILRHSVNLGKGRAIKDAMLYFLKECEGMNGIITVDSDGQHTVEDVSRIAAAMSDNPESLVLGARDFNAGNVPPKSKFGNKCTRIVMKLFIGGDIHDTQTGLRGIPTGLIERFSTLSGDRFEYETVMLMDAIQSKADIKEVPIHTVYIDNNSETHFKPIVDSLKIYKVILATFIRYTLSSLSSFLVDYGIFCALIFALGRGGMRQTTSVWIATAAARICSSLFNYTINKKIVFKSRRGLSTLAMYYILCAVQMACSALAVSLIGMTGFPVQIAKIIVDTVLFMISYRIQKSIIFR